MLSILFLQARNYSLNELLISALAHSSANLLPTFSICIMEKIFGVLSRKLSKRNKMFEVILREIRRHLTYLCNFHPLFVCTKLLTNIINNISSVAMPFVMSIGSHNTLFHSTYLYIYITKMSLCVCLSVCLFTHQLSMVDLRAKKNVIFGISRFLWMF